MYVCLYMFKDPLCEGPFFVRIGSVDLRELTRVPRWSPAAASSCPCPADGPPRSRWREGAGPKDFFIVLCAAAFGWFRHAVSGCGCIAGSRALPVQASEIAFVGRSWLVTRPAYEPEIHHLHAAMRRCGRLVASVDLWLGLQLGSWVPL